MLTDGGYLVLQEDAEKIAKAMLKQYTGKVNANMITIKENIILYEEAKKISAAWLNNFYVKLYMNVTGKKMTLDEMIGRDNLINTWRMNKLLSDTANIRF